MPRVKAASEIAIRDRDSGARCMNEAAPSRIDAHVIDAAFANAKEHQVPGRKLRDRHWVRGPLLLGRGTRNGKSHALVDVARKPAAVEAGSICTAELVRRADERGCERGDRIPRGGARRLTRRADTTGNCDEGCEHGPGENGRGSHQGSEANAPWRALSTG